MIVEIGPVLSYPVQYSALLHLQEVVVKKFPKLPVLSETECHVVLCAVHHFKCLQPAIPCGNCVRVEKKNFWIRQYPEDTLFFRIDGAGIKLLIHHVTSKLVYFI